MKKYNYLFLLLFIYLASVGILLLLSTRVVHALIYTLDDAYIHMAIAKHFIEDGVWGITKFSYSSTTSSPLWTLLISLNYIIFGTNVYTPFYLNMVFGCLSIISFYYILKSYGLSGIYIFIFSVVFIFSAPLPAIAYMGMEHSMQIFFVLLFAFYSVKLLTQDRTEYIYLLSVISPLMLMTRYEMTSLLLVVVIFLVIKKKIKYAVLLPVISFLPLIVYGLISIKNGSYFLPNSIIVKTGAAAIESDITGFFISKVASLGIYAVPVILISAAIIVFIYLKFGKFFDTERKIFVLILFFTAIIHLPITRIGSFFRYEAYLAVLLVLNIALNVQLLNSFEFRYKKIILVLLAVMISLPLGQRAYKSYINTPRASINIHQQQNQMGLFIKQYHNNENIILNDIGFVNYISDIKITDLCGLGDNDIAGLKNYKDYNALKNILKQHRGKYAVIYEKWFPDLSKEWIKAEEWTIPDNVICGDEKVSFYALKSEDKEIFISNIREFNKKLPEGVKYTLR